MAANRRRRSRVEGTSEGTILDAVAILESVNAMAAAIRDSIDATNRVAERLNRHNGAENNHEPMTLASFLKINPPQFMETLVLRELMTVLKR
ncbi:hypothetical protein AHAS_Ahas18G0184500 [Arachis hypogaea]